MDPAAHVRQENEMDRLTAELAVKFSDVPAEELGDAVPAEFVRRESRTVQDFVSVFAERSVRGMLRKAS